jgi:peroxiredoxin
MRQLREFAQHKSDFDQLNTRVVGISVDNQTDAKRVWDKMTNRQFTILSDPGALVIRQYGLLHADGKGDEDIAIRTTLLIDEQGGERWRRVSNTIPDIPTAEEALQHIRETK